MPARLQPLDIGIIQIPYHFRCPISLELMTDPVIIETGQTYDRGSIDSWIATGNCTCPVTRLPLTDFTVIPNHTIRRLIQDWCVTNQSFGVERIPTPKQPADPDTVQALLKTVSSVSNSRHARLSAARRLRGLARDSEKNRLLISTHKACEVLLDLLFSNNSSELIHESLGILSMLALTETECVSVSSDSNKVSFLITLLSNTSIDVRVNTAALLENVMAGTRSQDLRLQMSSHDEIFDGIIGIIDYPLSYPRALKVGIKALFAFCMVKQHRHKAVEAGAVDALIDRLSDFEKCDAERGIATVELLSRIPEGSAAIAANALAIPLLVKLILKVSNRATEYAAGALLALLCAVERLQLEAVEAGLLNQLLLLLQSECTERAKRKAQLLLKVTKHLWPENVAVNSDDIFPY